MTSPQDGDDIDRAFDDIVSRWDAPTAQRPDGEADPARSAGPTTPDAVPTERASATRPREIVWRAPQLPLSSAPELPEDDDDHFEPGPTAPLPDPEADPHFWGILVGLVGGPLLLLYVIVFDRDGSGWWVFTGIAATVVGFVLLVIRGGAGHDDADDGIRL